MPGLIKRAPRNARQLLQMPELRERSARRLLHEDVLAPLKREPCSLIVELGWGADGDGIEFGPAIEHLLERTEIRDAG